jgi:transglutaminase-like putative cysteine protease
LATNRPSPAPRLALAGLSAASAIGLVRVFADAGWLVPAVLAAVLPHLLFMWSDRRRWSPMLMLPVVVACGIGFAMIVTAPSTTFHGIPTAATFGALRDNLGLASHVLRTAVVPVAPTGPALTLALVALTADWLAWRLDATLGALGPSLVLFVAVAALGEGAHWPTTLLYGTAAAGFLLSAQYTELLGRRTWFHVARDRRSHLLTGGLVATGLVVIVALIVGPLLPGARSDAWFDYRGMGQHRGTGTWRTVTPLVDIKSRLVDQSDTELFKVKATHAQYWRMVALDQFDGEVWGLESEGENAGSGLHPELGVTGSVTPVYQTFEIEALQTRWLPAAYRAQRIDGTSALVIPDSASLVSTHASADGMRYVVTSYVPTPTRDELETVPPSIPETVRTDLELPSDFPSSVSQLARDITANASTEYDKALALQNYLRSDRFTYSLKVSSGHSDRALEHFLFKTHTGYCEQFAGSFAAMARAIGLPTRVAVGFVTGDLQSDGYYHITNKQAHAWPEVWFNGVGWVSFEPTKGRYEPSTNDPTGTYAHRPATASTTSTTTAATSSTTAVGATKSTSNPNLDGKKFDVNGGATQKKHHNDNVAPRALIALIVIAGLALLAIIATFGSVLGVKWARRHRRRHAADQRDRVIGAWSEALDRLREAGVAPRASATPVEFAMRHAAAHGAGLAGPPLMDLARLQTAALFAPTGPSTDDGDTAWNDVHLIERALRRATRRSRRWKRRLDPRSL